MEWISVEDKLPEKHGWYLVLKKGNKVEFSSNTQDFSDTLIHDILEFKGRIGVVKYWMPLPEPPKEEI